MQRIGVTPCLSAALTFLLTSSSDSAWYSRRSEWPTVTKLQPSFASIAPEMSPVYAPDSCGDTSCAPWVSGSLSPSIRVCTLRMSVNGGSTATSTFA